MERADESLAFILQYENIAWYEAGEVRILDRRVYPQKIHYVICKTYQEVAQAIADMVTQSAGPYTAAGMGMALAAYEARFLKGEEFSEYMSRAAYVLSNARPTTKVRMKAIVDECLMVAEQARINVLPIDREIFNHTINTLNGRYKKIEKIASYLINVFPQETNLLTYCYAETIVGQVLKLAKQKNRNVKVFCPETRPYLQGSRLTASVVYDMGFDVTVITDNMVSYALQTQKINVFTTAADAICMDGSVINKIGTSQLAIVCKYYGIPYFVTGAPDKGKETTDYSDIEMRNSDFVLEIMGHRIAKEGVKGLYPAFDITLPHLISGVVTDLGIYSPYDLNMYYKQNGQGEY